MVVRSLAAGDLFDPDEIAFAQSAFDAAWTRIVADIQADRITKERVRDRLASVILTLVGRPLGEREVLVAAALRELTHEIPGLRVEPEVKSPVPAWAQSHANRKACQASALLIRRSRLHLASAQRNLHRTRAVIGRALAMIEGSWANT